MILGPLFVPLKQKYITFHSKGWNKEFPSAVSMRSFFCLFHELSPPSSAIIWYGFGIFNILSNSHVGGSAWSEWCRLSFLSSWVLSHILSSSVTFLFFKDFIYLYLERGEGSEKEWERNINVWLSLVLPLLGAWPATQACTLTGNWTSNPVVHRPALNPLKHTSQGFFDISIMWLEWRWRGVTSFTLQIRSQVRGGYVTCLVPTGRSRGMEQRI